MLSASGPSRSMRAIALVTIDRRLSGVRRCLPAEPRRGRDGEVLASGMR